MQYEFKLFILIVSEELPLDPVPIKNSIIELNKMGIEGWSVATRLNNSNTLLLQRKLK